MLPSASRLPSIWQQKPAHACKARALSGVPVAERTLQQKTSCCRRMLQVCHYWLRHPHGAGGRVGSVQPAVLDLPGVHAS
jgi:hypothetical protein